jgi:hypothetical protein
MRRRLVAVLLGSAVLGGVAPAVAPVSAPGPLAPTVALAKPCSAGWTHAVLRDGSHKCLRAGQFCAARNERVYQNKGFTCRSGRLRRS